jgi:hypothetical protein
MLRDPTGRLRDLYGMFNRVSRPGSQPLSCFALAYLPILAAVPKELKFRFSTYPKIQEELAFRECSSSMLFK